MNEILSGQVGAVIGQDVLPIDDLDPQFPEPTMTAADIEDYYEMLIGEEEARAAKIDEIRRTCNFQSRNAALAEAGDFVAKAARSDGAAHLHGIGGDTIGIRGVSDANERAGAERSRATELARAACRLCPLSSYCELYEREGSPMPQISTNSADPEEIAKAQRRRDRLRGRVKKGDYVDNTHFCETNFTDQRLSQRRP